ncbi:MAG: D-aminoacylase [Promethearchaeota archaeon]|nr:MAG: D-aminoacylase [Candidatus Lokiarchaeota archaeon]
MDLIIKNGRIIDGTGNPWYKADIAIKDGIISKIRPKINENTNQEIDASNLFVSPGFIDIHSHTDIILPFYSKMDSFIQQGITTCVVGMCGGGLAPINPNNLDQFKKTLAATLPIYENYDFKWNTFNEYLIEMQKLHFPSNLVFFVGFENIRIAGGPAFENRPPTNEELTNMKKYLKEALEAGAFGMSTGLIYAPQIFAKTEEIVELAKVLKDYNGLYFSHIRGEGKTIKEAIKEMIHIVEKSKCIGGQIAHHKISGREFWGQSEETLQLIEEANTKGLSIYCDSYPYNRCMTGLATGLPPWAREGNDEEKLKRLQNPETREKIKKSVMEDIEEWENLIYENGFEYIFLSSVKTEKWKAFIGKSITEITKARASGDEWATFFEILIDEKMGVYVTIEDMGEEDIRRILSNRYQMVASDGAAIPANPALGAFHPRFFGTFPRVLAKYVREENLLTLENAIRKMTSFPAQRLGLKDRGMIREGMSADIVIFDSNLITDKATFINAHQFPEGILYVIVNGKIVVENGKQKRKYPGKIIRRPT